MSCKPHSWKSSINSVRRSIVFGLLAAVILLISSFSTKAASYYWNATTGDWSTATNWGGTEPTSSDSAYVNNGGTTTITQTGERCNNLYLGASSTDTGTVEMTGGSLSASKEYIGNSGTGTFTQTGGTNSISSYYSGLYLGYNSGSSGTYDLSGSGQLSSAGYEYIGYSGTGTFTQTGGTNTISSSLYLGYNSGSSGRYDLSGTGQLSASAEYIGDHGMGTFTQTGGTNTATYIKIGAVGTYTLSGGTLNINGGFENQGIWDLSNSSAVINMSSAIINLYGTILANAGNATLNIDSHSLLIVPSGHNATDYFANINNAGILHQAGSALDISSAYSIYGIGSIADHVNCQGTLSATSGYSINLNGGLTISGTGSVDLRSGTLYVNDAISGMDGGSLKASYQYIGSTGTGTFTQTGGTNTISTSLYLGYNSGSSGTYNLSGTGNLSAPQEYIG